MKIPKTIIIKGKLWKVEHTPGLAKKKDADGICSFSERIIHLEKTLPKKLKPAVFFHELIHATLYELHLSTNDGWVDGLIEEVICDGVSQTILENFCLKKKPQKAKG